MSEIIKQLETLKGKRVTAEFLSKRKCKTFKITGIISAVTEEWTEFKCQSGDYPGNPSIINTTRIREVNEIAQENPICPYFKKLNVYSIDCQRGQVPSKRFFLKEVSSALLAQKHHDKHCCKEYTSCSGYMDLEKSWGKGL